MKDLKFLKENGVDTDKSLELFGDIDTYNQTMSDFLDAVDEKISKLNYFKDKNELYNYAVFAHSLKSDARYLGFKTVADVAFNHENAGKSEDKQFISKDFDNLLDNIKEMEKIVKRYLTEEPDAGVRLISHENFKKTIMVADDSTLILNIAKKALEGVYNVILASDGEEVINNLEKKIDVLLLDLNMPNKNGFDVLEYFKERDLFKKINVSIITGDEGKETIDNAFSYPIIDMLNKPFSMDELKRVVEKTLAHKNIS